MVQPQVSESGTIDLVRLAYLSTATFATWYQSTYGTTAAFRFIQSAAMGGWAAPVVKTAAMGVSVALAGAAEWCKWRGNGTNTS